MTEDKNLRLVEWWEKEWDVKPRDCAPLEETQAQAVDRVAASKPAREKVFDYIERHQDDAIEFLQSLVRIPSVNPSEKFESELADYLAEKTEQLGMTVRQLEPAPLRKSNFAFLTGDPSGKTLLFNSHLDTVPAGDLSKWKYDPFAATIVNGKMYGRGTKDMKAGLAAAYMAIKAIVNSGVDLRGNLAMSSTADEERGGHWGLHKMVEAGWLKDIDFAVYTEGTLERITTGARGKTQFNVTVHGQATHTGRKSLGTNAIVNAAKVIPALDALRFQNWEENPLVPGQPVASVNLIKGGFKENVVPDTCVLGVDLRFPPGTTPDGVMKEVNRVLDDVAYEHPYLGGVQTDVEVFAVGRPYAQKPDEPIVQFLRESANSVLGYRPDAIGMHATSDARWLVLDGGIPTVNYAAGNETGHQPNEYIDLEGYFDTIRIYASLALAILD